MKNSTLLILLMALGLAGCSRSGPASSPVEPVNNALKPVEVISLAPAITEPSGIVYSPGSNTFFVVSDSRPEVFEISAAGVVQRTLPTNGSDLEGIALSAGGDSLFLAEERNQAIDTYTRAGRLLSVLPVKVATLANNALEGVTVDAQGHLWIINEKMPRLLLEFAGTQEISRREIAFVDDLSDICCDPGGQGFWIISDESRKVIRISRTGELLGEWNLPFDKGEGIALAGAKMYIVNDQDAKLYIFSKPI
ncbi:MAG TPA: SdiA-regulated domain-containing protein [bacterium]|nr:SdiA-regulated domain-containing protein [bacterium]HQG44066.1 SdiA-regulated domain-containing protein [bacterium]HQI48738.1 SdiA-regulated domain-containing protein [bacterium]HQJ65225.1 SdiA-regulated domain-containing protein [bacterium]